MRVFLSTLAVALVASACSTGPMNNPSVQGELMLEPAQPNATIVANAAAQPELSSLVAAAQRAGLADALSGPGPFTVFAPINSAFDGLDLSSLSTTELQNVLKYHVVPGKIMAADLVEGDRLVTLAEEGQGLTVSRETTDRLQMTVDGVAIIAADIPASNGVIHLINTVLMPESGGDDN